MGRGALTTGVDGDACGATRRRRVALAWPVIVSASLLGACAGAPRVAEYREGSLAGLPAMVDGRAAFRQVFCDIHRRLADEGGTDDRCETLLWRLSDEPTTPAVAALALPASPRPLRFLLVTGAFDDCYGDEGLPFHEAALALAAAGHRLDTLRLSGRSSAESNAEALARDLRPRIDEGSERLVLIGYSKGVVDILQLLAAHPEVAESVAAVVGVAGPVQGTPLAEAGAGLYDGLLSHALAGRCSPGDGGVIDSLVPEVRRRALAAHPLPEGVRFYSLMALPEWDVVAAGLKPSWRWLARSSRFNDGQVRVQDAVLPGATVLGFANADHWGIALRIERAMPHIAGRTLDRPYPQRALLEAILLALGGEPAP